MTGNPIKHNLLHLLSLFPPCTQCVYIWVYNGLLIKSLNKSDTLLHMGVHHQLSFLLSLPSLSFLLLYSVFLSLIFFLFLSLFYTHIHMHARTHTQCIHSTDVQQNCWSLSLPSTENSPGNWSMACCLEQQMGKNLPGEGNIKGLLSEIMGINSKWTYIYRSNSFWSYNCTKLDIPEDCSLFWWYSILVL